MATFYQKQGEYPYLEGLPDVVETMSEPLPEGLFFQKQGEYPYLKNLPDTIGAMIFPIPPGLFAQNPNVNDGYPYLDLPELITDLTKPLPYSMQKPNKAKKTTQGITIPKQDVFTVTIPRYRQQTITITQHKQQIISMIDGVIT